MTFINRWRDMSRLREYLLIGIIDIAFPNVHEDNTEQLREFLNLVKKALDDRWKGRGKYEFSDFLRDYRRYEKKFSIVPHWEKDDLEAMYEEGKDILRIGGI